MHRICSSKPDAPQEAPQEDGLCTLVTGGVRGI